MKTNIHFSGSIDFQIKSRWKWMTNHLKRNLLGENIYLTTWWKHDHSDVHTTEGSKLTGFLENPSTTLGECDTKVVLVAHLFYLNLLTTSGLFEVLLCHVFGIHVLLWAILSDMVWKMSMRCVTEECLGWIYRNTQTLVWPSTSFLWSFECINWFLD